MASCWDNNATVPSNLIIICLTPNHPKEIVRKN
ncbi:hypothetical protein J467_4595, partial [Acinetobacter baumannii 916567]